MFCCNAGAGCTVLDTVFHVIQISLQCMHSYSRGAGVVVIVGCPQPPQCVFEPIWNHCRDGVGTMGMLRAGRRSVGRSASLEVLEAGTKTDETRFALDSGHHGSSAAANNMGSRVL